MILIMMTNHPSVESPPHFGAEVMAENLEDCKYKKLGIGPVYLEILQINLKT